MKAIDVMTELSRPLFPALQCSSTPAVLGFIDHVTNRSETEILIIGADCSVASQPVAALAQFWNLVQVRNKVTSCPIKNYINMHLIPDISMYVYLGTDITRLSISSTVQQSNVPHLPTYYWPWGQHCTRDYKADAALELEASCHYHSRGGCIHTGKHDSHNPSLSTWHKSLLHLT